jgi:hypothetical protein
MLRWLRKMFSPLQRGVLTVRSVEETQRRHIRREFYQARGVIPLLMKRRNGEKWSAEERAILLRELRALSHLSPYLIPLLMPGGVLLLPLVAWWMDHRRKKHKSTRDHR